MQHSWARAHSYVNQLRGCFCSMLSVTTLEHFMSNDRLSHVKNKHARKPVNVIGLCFISPLSSHLSSLISGISLFYLVSPTFSSLTFCISLFLQAGSLFLRSHTAAFMCPSEHDFTLPFCRAPASDGCTAPAHVRALTSNPASPRPPRVTRHGLRRSSTLFSLK